jgi:photosystem II stability/assembly factor-like uncharacterized protein
MKKLSFLLMLFISVVFVTGCKKETSTVVTTSTGSSSNSSDWDSVYTFEEPPYFQFSDNQKIAVFGNSTPFGFKTILTTDGGLTWSSKTSNFIKSNPSGMIFFDKIIGFSVSYSPSGHVIAKTEDGGLNWTVLNTQDQIFNLITNKSLVVFTTDSVHIIENGDMTSHFRDNRNFREFFDGYNPAYFFTNNAIYLHSSNVNGTLNVLKSVDNGKTWQETTFGASFGTIKPFNTTTWYSVSQYSLYVTKDSGTSWNKVDNASYDNLKVTNGIIFSNRGVSSSEMKPVYSTDGINYKENKLASKNGYEFFSLNGRVYYRYGQNLYRRKF